MLSEELGAVCKAGGVDGLGEEVVIQYCGELIGGHVCDCGSEVLESFVRGREDGYVGLIGEGGDLVGGVEGAFEGGDVEGVQGVGNVGGWNEQGVDYLNDSAIELEVLRGVVSLFVSYRLRILTGLTSWVTVHLLPWPLTKTTTFPACSTFSTLCPPVTFVYSVLCKSVGMNTGVPGTSCAASRVPCKIWYSRTLVITSWSLFLKASLSEEYGILLKASLLGARIWRRSTHEVRNLDSDKLTVTPWYEGNCNKIEGYFYIKSVSTRFHELSPSLDILKTSRTHLNQTIECRQILLPCQQSPQIRQRSSLRIRSSNQSHGRRSETSPTRRLHICSAASPRGEERY